MAASKQTTYISCCDCPTWVIVKPNVKRCTPCRDIERRRVEVQANERKRLAQKSARLKTEPIRREIKQTTDADTLHGLSCFVRAVVDVGASGPLIRYEPGTAEFLAVCAQIRPIRNVRRGLSGDTTYIDAESIIQPRFRRLESVNSL